METKEQKLPNWFTGQAHEEGLIVENPFSKEEYELNNIELSVYDFIMESSNDFRKALNWFRKNNPEAYMALLKN